MAQSPHSSDRSLSSSNALPFAIRQAAELVSPNLVDPAVVTDGLNRLTNEPTCRAFKEQISFRGFTIAVRHVLEQGRDQAIVDDLLSMSYLALNKRIGAEAIALIDTFREFAERRPERTPFQSDQANRAWLALRNAIGFLYLSLQASRDPNSIVINEEQLRQVELAESA